MIIHNHPTRRFPVAVNYASTIESHTFSELSHYRMPWHFFWGIEHPSDPSRRPQEPVWRPHFRADGRAKCQASRMEKFAAR